MFPFIFFWKRFNRKIKKPRLIRLYIKFDIWTQFYGLLTTLGLIATVYYTIQGIKNIDNGEQIEYVEIFMLLSSSIIVLIAVIIFNTVFYSRKLSRMAQLPLDYQFLKNEKDKFDIALNQISSCSHIITHYHRNITIRIDQFMERYQLCKYIKSDSPVVSTIVQKKKKKKKNDTVQNENIIEFDDIEKEMTGDIKKSIIKEIKEISEKMDDFFVILTSNLQSYFSFITGDKCAVSLKLLNNEKLTITTFFRDPVSLKHRRNADGLNYGECHYNQNTAFDIILDESYSDVFFADNNLFELYKDFRYENPNPDWSKYYNSTIVVPISLLYEKNARNYIGFLCVDNFRGNLAFRSNIEYMFAVSDLLYTLLDKYGLIIRFANKLNYTNDKIKRFKDWPQCQ